MKATLSDFSLRFGKIPLLVDSTSAISIAKNPILHSRTKHIDVRLQVDGVDNAQCTHLGGD
ncbi:hypothetical protein U9M48_039812 [Paspalum notatum var. saurae]|uniref:Uncharacterized protein n=1 Tax=Paspalum notatum var. saurae TaxID=547442 RepID=A0AAQ3ULF8_PASNO